MNILDDLKKIKQLDRSKVHQSIELLGKQCGDAWQKVQSVDLPLNYCDFENVIVCGMGGSALGAHVIQSLYQDELKIPLVICRDHFLPGFAGPGSLVILSSYSGNTEETLSCAQEVIEKGLRCFVISSNGQLEQISQKNQFPRYTINPVYNSCGQPRMAIGYSIFSQLALFAKLGLINLKETAVKAALRLIKKSQEQYSLKRPTASNLAKQTALRLEKKIPILVAAEHLVGAAHVFNNQLNENAKHFSEYRVIPELNHHLMEGLGFPRSNPEGLAFLLINSEFYRSRIKARFQLTAAVVRQNKIQASDLAMPVAADKLQEVFGLISFGAWISFYLAMQHQLDPAPIPWVDFFKKELETLAKKHE